MLFRAAMTGMIDAAREAKDKGSFSFVERAVPNLNDFFG